MVFSSDFTIKVKCPLFLLFNNLDFVDEETQMRWNSIYNDMFNEGFK